MNKPVNSPIAKLLKEKGFNGKCKEYFTDGTLSISDEPKEVSMEAVKHNKVISCLAPTIADVVMWIYEKHGIWISVSITIQKEYYYQCIDITGKKDSTKNNYPSRICKPGNYYNSPTEAYEAAIEHTLNNLIQKL